ncbi:ATP-binding protein [Paenibacillus gansuensis]|uniref:histidine kinase n=1 Tax=Paenibacillus gansuensis TaxID=306542 RepID=A0ABW5PKA5_9BACL
MYNEGFKELILCFLLLLLPVFIYRMYFGEDTLRKWKLPKYWRWAFYGAATVLTMNFPLRIAEGYQFDLRQIPFIVGSFYGGPALSFFLYAVTCLYRIWLGGGGVVSALISSTLILLLIQPVLSRYKALPSKSRTVFAAGTAVVFAATWIGTAVAMKPSIIGDIFLQLQLLLVEVFSVVLLVTLIESSRNRMMLLEEVRKSEKMKVVGELAASVAHEVRNPLTVTRGFIQLMQHGRYTEDKKKEFIELALRELNRAQDILSDYLSFAKPQMENVERLNVATELRYVADVMSPYALMQEVFFENDLTYDLWIQGDRQKFHQSLINLVKNSIEAMPGGGSLYLSAIPLGACAEIRIRDTGIGMNSHQLQRLGQPYFSSKDKGTGLGMMVVFSIVEAMGGIIKVESQVGRGTVFIIRLPLVSNAAFQLVKDA